MDHPDLGCIFYVLLILISAQLTLANIDQENVQIVGENAPGKGERNPVGDSVEIVSCNTTKQFPCDCYKDGRLLVVECSRQNLTSVPPNIPTDAFVLKLSHNKLIDIPCGTFRKMAELETLDLAHNHLARLKSGTFLGLRQLKKLILNENLLNMSSGSFADNVFAPLSNLTYLNLKSSSLVDDHAFEYPDVALSKLPALETLLINGLSNKTFKRGVRAITALRTLDMSSTPSFRSLAKDTFINFRNINIYNLNLSHCSLTWIHQEAFLNLPNIDTIDYSYNEHLEIKGVGISFYGLQNSTIKKIFMQRVHTKHPFTVMYKEDVQNLANTALEEFHLDNNSICMLGEGVIRALPLSLKVLRASWNSIQIYEFQAVSLLRLINLEEFDGSYQELYGKPVSRKAKSNTVSNGSVTNTFGGHLGQNFFSAITYNRDSRSKGNSIPLPPNLWMINCSHTYKLLFTFPALQFASNSLKVVNFAYNFLIKWIGPIKGMENLRYADLTGNNCQEVSEFFFAYMTGLETLLIGKNRLGTGNHLREKTFYNLTSLKHLDMHDNQLKTVPNNLFCRLTNLTHLNLSHNYLSTWNADISALTRLEKLDLAHNSLWSLSASLYNDLDRNLRQSKLMFVAMISSAFVTQKTLSNG